LPKDRAIETHDLSKNYGDRLAVDRLNLTVASKQGDGFLGPDGAGKSTTIKMMVGLLRPTTGSLSILGQGVSGDNPRVRRKIGYMPELPRFPKHLSGEELLDVYGRMYGMSKTERQGRITELIKMVGLEGRGKDRIGKYSKGMQQRIGIAQALISDPELVILDEPSIGLACGNISGRSHCKDARGRRRTRRRVPQPGRKGGNGLGGTEKTSRDPSRLHCPSLLRIPMEYSKEEDHHHIHHHIRHRDRSARFHPDSRRHCKPAPSPSGELYIRLRRNRGLDGNLPLPRWCRNDHEHRLGRVR